MFNLDSCDPTGPELKSSCWPGSNLCKVDRVHGNVPGGNAGTFTVTLETCDVLPDAPIQGALSERFGADWLLVILATCARDKSPSGPHVLLIKDKELFYQHMRGANLYV